jgi:hypothetical protein
MIARVRAWEARVAGCGSSHEDRRETGCPFCDGDIPDHIVERIMAAAAGPRSKTMSAGEFRVWLDDIGRNVAGDR